MTEQTDNHDDLTRRAGPELDTRAAARPSTWDASSRTVELVYSTGASVQRYDWRRDAMYSEVLEVSDDAIDLDRVRAGAVPLLLNHAASIGSVIGVIEDAWIETIDGASVAVARARLSDRPDISDIVADMQAGIRCSVSVGYSVAATREETDEAGRRTITATRWIPAEISLVAIPADAGARLRSADTATLSTTPAVPNMEFKDMTHRTAADAAQTATPAVETRADTTTTTQTVDLDAVRAAERSRIEAIQGMQARYALDADFVQRHVAAGTSAADARVEALEVVAERSAAERVTGATATVVRDERETLIQRATDALYSRATGTAPTDAARELRGLSLVELARQFGGASGAMSASQAVDAALSQRSWNGTSAFSSVLSNVVGRTLRAAYEAQQRTFTPFVRTVELADFRPVSRVSLGDAPQLVSVPEGADFTHGVMGDSGESYSLATYGKIVRVTRQALINDDLSAFSRIPSMIGARAAELESDLVYGILANNGLMSDGNALFSTEHANIALADLDVAGMAAVRALGRKQTSAEGAPINVSFTTIVVNPDDELAAERLVGSIVASQAGDFNPFVGRVQIVADPRVPAGQWFAAANPVSIDTIELGFLAGARGVQIMSRDGWEVDGVEVKARLDVGAKAIDWRGLACGIKPE